MPTEVSAQRRSTYLYYDAQKGNVLKISRQLNISATRAACFIDMSKQAATIEAEKAEIERQSELFMGGLKRSGTGLPVLVTEPHFYSLPFYQALVRKHDEKIGVISLDAHLDGICAFYENWSFWGAGIRREIVNPKKLLIVGSSQVGRAEAFAKDYDCARAVGRFRPRYFEQYRDLLDDAAQKVFETIGGREELAKIRNDKRLRDFAEYAALRNAGVGFSDFSVDSELLKGPIFVSFDTDVTFSADKLFEIANKMRSTRIVGIHVSELSRGIDLHGKETIERTLNILTHS